MPGEKGEGRMFAIPDWVWEFHGHRCPFMPIGYRMGKAAMEKLGIGKVKDHGAFALIFFRGIQWVKEKNLACG